MRNVTRCFLASLLLCLSGSVARAANFTVNAGAGGLVFWPSNLTVSAGDTVTWVFSGGFSHNTRATSCVGSANCSADLWNSGNPVPSGSFSHTFSSPGTYFYQCDPHAMDGMIGMIVVNPVVDFTVDISNPDLTAFTPPGAVFQGTLGSVNGYSQSVTLSCQSGAAICAASPSILTPPAPFTVLVNDAPADYSAFIQGSDGVTLHQSQLLSLHLMAMGTPSPGTVNALPGFASSASTIMLSGGTASVALACTGGLPAGASCNFSPPGPYSVANGQPVPVGVTVTAPANAAAADSNLTVTATANASAMATQALTLHVSDYALSLSPLLIATLPGTPAQFSGTLSALNGYTSGSIKVSCQGAGKPATCSGGSFALNGASAPFTVSAADTPAQDFSFTIQAQDSSGLTRSLPAALRVEDLSLTAASPASLSMTASSLSPVVSFDLVPINFAEVVTVQCRTASLPVNLSCGFGPGLTASQSVFVEGVPAHVAMVVKAEGATATGTPQQIFVDATANVGQTALTRSRPLDVTVNTAVTDTDLSVTLTHAPDLAPLGGGAPGGPLVFSAVIANAASGADAADVTLSLAFSGPVVIGPMSLPMGCSTDGITVTCSTPLLAAGATAEFDIPVVPLLARSVTATATVSSAGVTESGVNALANNTASSAAQTRFRPLARPGLTPLP